MFPYEEYKELCEIFGVTALSLDNPDLFGHYDKLCELHRRVYASGVTDGGNGKKLNWSEYVKLAIRTESIPHIALITNEAQTVEWNNTKTVRLLHAALGICTELAELKDGDTIVNLVEEIGDVYWYLAIADDVLSWQETIPYSTVVEKSAMFYLGEIQDVIKRHIFYGKELDTVRISTAFKGIAWHLLDDLNKRGLRVEDSWEANIIKLEKRYPDKFFDSKFAIHRDTDRELDHIAHDGSLLVKQETLLDMEDATELKEIVESRSEEGVLTVPPVEYVLQRWEQLKAGVHCKEDAFQLVDGIPPFQGIRDFVCSFLEVTYEQAIEILGKEITECQFCWHYKAEYNGYAITAVPYQQEEKSVEAHSVADAIMRSYGIEDTYVDISPEEFNKIVTEVLTSSQIEKLATGLCYSIAENLRKKNCTLEARAYDTLIRSFLGKNCQLTDYSVYSMWERLGYSLHEGTVKEMLKRNWT